MSPNGNGLLLTGIENVSKPCREGDPQRQPMKRGVPQTLERCGSGLGGCNKGMFGVRGRVPAGPHPGQVTRKCSKSWGGAGGAPRACAPAH